jgi:hypothetical protein
MLYPKVYTEEEQHLPEGMNAVPADLTAEEQQEHRLAAGNSNVYLKKDQLIMIT